ncbi:Transport and Golgi organization protein 2 [Trinorchestia longiramus]|nr:Transport and Golgi organization protein 2 [Trinorchestia longiramus]
MCILFAYLNPNPIKGQYKVILANNRDELYSRPTKNAYKWEGTPGIIAGKDMMAGREGGTWLGISSNGKIASLLNILRSPVEAPKNDDKLESRGFLVVNYLRGQKWASEYLKNLAKPNVEYNKFNLVLIEPEDPSESSDITMKRYILMCYNSSEKQARTLGPGVHSFSNSYFDRPFQKQCVGKMNVQKLIEDIGPLMEKQDLLMDSLFEVMWDKTPQLPDEVMSTQGSGYPEVVLQHFARIFVTTPNSTYGTRTTTVVMVDDEDKATFHERTMRVPINPHDPQWDESVYTMQLS